MKNKEQPTKPIKYKAGVVPYRFIDDDKVEMLLITAREYPDSWIFPTGKVKKGETLEQAAARECAEESGYTVNIGDKLREIDVEHKNSIHRFVFFMGQVTGKIKNYETDREQKWVPSAKLLENTAEIFQPAALVAITKPVELLAADVNCRKQRIRQFSLPKNDSWWPNSLTFSRS